MNSEAALAIPNWLDTAARNHPRKLALAFATERWTFSELRDRADAVAMSLASHNGVGDGRLGILSANRPGFVFAVHAATRLGVPFVPLNWRQTHAEIAWQIEDANITTLIIDEARFGVAEAISANRAIAIVSIRELEKSSTEVGKAPRSIQTVHLNREAAVLYTSGTSGRPKGARLTCGNLWFSAVASALHLGHRADDVWLAAMPLFHIGGLSILIRGAVGATPVILHDRFDPRLALEAIENGATLMSVVPTMLQRMIELRGESPWPAHLHRVLLGGSAAPARLVADAFRLGIPLAPTYGLTETASQVATLLPDQLSGRESSSGRPLPLTEVRIATPDGPADAGAIGEIEVRGPTLFASYLRDSSGTSGLTADGWFATGDAGYLDADGFLHVVDRRDDLIVSGAENIYPAEIERVLREHPFVIDAGVVALPHETWGARPVAAVVWDGAPDIAEAELRRHCEPRLASFKIPDRFLILPELPRSPSGKLLRRALLEHILGKPDSAPPAV